MKSTKGQQARENSSRQTGQWARKVISIVKNTKQSGIEVTFDSPGPSPWLQVKMRAMGFRNSKRKVMWYADDSEEHNAFAEEIKTAILSNEDGPELILWPSVKPLNANLEKKEYCFVMFTLKNGQTKNYLVFEPSKPKAEIIASNFAADEFGEQLNVFAVLPKTRIKEARSLFASKQIIYADEQSRLTPLASRHTELPISETSAIQQERKSKVPVQTILLTTEAESRIPDFTGGVELHTWKEANAYIKSKIGTYSDVYYKVQWQNGDLFRGWVDIEPPEFFDRIENPLSNHIKSYLTNYSKVDEQHQFYKKEDVDYARHLLEDCLFEDPRNNNTEDSATDEKVSTTAEKNLTESHTDSQRSIEIEALNKFYKWAALNGKLREMTLPLLTEWLHENIPQLSDKNISNIWASHQRIEQSLNNSVKKRNLRSPFDSIYKKILKIIPGLIEHIKAGKTKGKSDMDPESGLMALNYDFLYYDKKGNPVIALSHYFRQNGDMVADPDMEIRLIPDMQIAEALTYQDQFKYEKVYTEKDGKDYVNLKLNRELNKFLNQWLTNLVHQGHLIDLTKDDEKEPKPEIKETPVPELEKQTSLLLVGTPVFDPTVMARLINSQNYLVNAWSLSHPKTALSKSRFDAGDFANLHAFFSIYVQEDSAMRAQYLELYGKLYTATVNLTFRDTDAPLPNVLVPIGTKEPFLSHGFKAYDMRSLLESQFPKLSALTNETLGLASPVQLYELAQLSNPKMYHIAVSQDKLIEIWRTRGKELFDTLGLPTNPYYPYADLIAGYENMIPLRDLLNDNNTSGDEWWIAAALYRPIADLEKAKTIVDDLIQKKELEKKTYLTADGERPRPNYKTRVEQMDRTIGYLKESQTVLLAYVNQTELTLHKDHLADEKGIYNQKSAGDNFEEIPIPIPPEAQYQAEVSIVRSSTGYRIGLSASKNFGTETYSGIMPRQTDKAYVSRQDALGAALQIHTDWLEEALSKPDADDDESEQNAQRLQLAIDAIETFALHNDITLNINQSQSEQVLANHPYDALANDSGVYTKESAGKNFETLEIRMPKSSGYQAEVFLVLTSTNNYKEGIHSKKTYGDNLGLSFFPSVRDKSYTTRKDALKAALLHHEQELLIMLGSKDTILNNESTKRKRVTLALNALHQFAKEQDIDLSPPPDTEENANLGHNTPAANDDSDAENEETDPPKKSDPLADDMGHYTSFSAGKNFETIHIPMPKSSGYEAVVYLVLTSEGTYKDGIMRCKSFGAYSYVSNFPEVGAASYRTRKSALKAALLHHEQQLEVLMGQDDSFLKTQDVKTKKLKQAMKALYQFASEQGISMEAVPDPTDLKIELVQGLEDAYWRESDNEDLKNLVTIMGVKFHQSRLRNAISKKLNELPLTLLKEIVNELTNRFSASVSLDEHQERLSKNTENYDETNERRWMVVYVDDLIFNNDVYPDNQQHPVMTFLIEQLYSGAARLADLPQITAGKQEQEKPIQKKQTQNRLNKKIETLIDQKDEVGADYSEEEKNYIQQYTGSGGLLSEGAQGRGTLYEYYTPDSIVKRMWDMAYHYGYDGGSILEPAVGTGHFFKYAPKKVSITGYETNHYACRISQIIYPHAQIHERAFETQFFAGNIHLRENFDNPHYSLIIGNPPYGSFTGKYAGLGEKKQTGASEYDQYFLLRSLDLLKPGGLLVFLISSYFMLSMQKYNSIKEKIHAKAELVDGYRLPANALPNTDVGTDIIVLRRRK